MTFAESKPIRIRLLGRVVVETSEGVASSYRSNRVPALLGWLVTHPGPQPRQVVAAQLWPEAVERVQRHNLRQTLVYLRQSFGKAADLALAATRSHLGLNLDAIESDVGVLVSTTRYCEPELKIGLYEAAVNLVEGAFMPGIDDDWIRDERAHLMLVYVRALLALADYQLENDPETALSYANRAILEEPLLDGARVRKLKALVRMGEHTAAQLEYEAFAELLDHELGLTPSDAVRNALNDQPVIPRRTVVPDRPNVSTDLTFALDTLGFGDRPDRAVSLALAAVPHWMEVGTPGLGIEKIQQAIDRSKHLLSNARIAEARVAVAELSLSKGDVMAAEDLLKEVTQTGIALTNQTQFQILLVHAWIHLSRLEGKSAAMKAQAALQIAEGSQDLLMKCDALAVKATAELYTPNLSQALSDAEATLALAKQLGQKMSGGAAHLTMAQVLEADGRAEAAEENVQMGLQIVEGIQSPRAARHRLSSARLMENLGRLDEAEAGYRRALSEIQNFENQFLEALALTYLGDIVQDTGRPREAVALHSRAVGIRRDLNQDLGVATSLRGLGKAYSDLNELNAAREALLESAHLYLNEEAMPGYASVLLALAVVEEKSDRPSYAVSLARRARKLLRGMTVHEKRSIGRSGVSAVTEASSLIARCA